MGAKDSSAGDCSRSDNVEVVVEESRQAIDAGEASVMVEQEKVEKNTFGCCAGWQCASHLLISGVRFEAEWAVPAVGRLAVQLQAALVLEPWEEG